MAAADAERPVRHAVVILNWNGRAWLERFLGAVEATTPETVALVVADNGSTDDSAAYVAAHHPRVHFLAMDQNRGYAGGYNTALRHLRAQWPELDLAVLMNSDIEPLPLWWPPLEAAFAANPRLGAAQPVLRSHAEPDRFEYAGGAGGCMDLLAYPYAYGRVFDSCEVDSGQYREPAIRPVFWASGACLVVRTAAFEAAGRLDESLFAHMEEIDLCWRMHRAGWDVACVNASTVLHVGGGTLNALHPRKTFLNFRNNLFVAVRNLPPHIALPVVLARLVLDGLAGIRFLLQRKPEHTWAIVRAHFAFYGRLHRAVLAPDPFPRGWPTVGVYRGSLVWRALVRKKTTAPPL